MNNLYKAKVGNAYVKNIWVCMDGIEFTHRADKMNYFKDIEKEYLLRLFPEAEIKEYKIVENGNAW